MTINNQLILRQDNFVGKQPFDGDLLDRKGLGIKLEKLIGRLKEGAVLAIDSPWGEGKTWFGRNWASYLENSEYTVIYLDAFENDYLEDPFLLIVSEITNAFRDELPATAFKEKAIEVMGAIMPLVLKVLLNAAGRIVLGTANVEGLVKEIGEKAVEDANDEAKEWFKSKIDSHSQEKQSIKSFKQALSDLANSDDKPLVLIIDELDRCKPLFAIQLIERLKHFFDVPNLVFVLLMNRSQMENAVKGVYGEGTDAAKYLSKFINFNFKLPKRFSYEVINNDHIQIFIDQTFLKYDFKDLKDPDGFKTCLGTFAKYLKFSWRDIERAIALFAYAQPANFGSLFFAYFIALKLSKPDIYEKILNSDRTGHSEAKQIADSILEKFSDNQWGPQRQIGIISQMHNAYMTNFVDVGHPFDGILSGYNNDYGIYRDQFTSLFTSKIDLNID